MSPSSLEWQRLQPRTRLLVVRPPHSQTHLLKHHHHSSQHARKADRARPPPQASTRASCHVESIVCNFEHVSRTVSLRGTRGDEWQAKRHELLFARVERSVDVRAMTTQRERERASRNGSSSSSILLTQPPLSHRLTQLVKSNPPPTSCVACLAHRGWLEGGRRQLEMEHKLPGAGADTPTTTHTSTPPPTAARHCSREELERVLEAIGERGGGGTLCRMCGRALARPIDPIDW
jgi:hypothetical protein